MLALMGSCTARTKDKCTVTYFSCSAFIFFVYFLFCGSLMIILSHNEEAFIDKFCSSDESLRSTESPADLTEFENLAFDLQDAIFKDTRIKFKEIDK